MTPRALVLALVILAAVGCGKKGPLLPPYVRQPAAAEISSARRVGSDVYVTVRVPDADLDGATPASLATVEVWAVTAQSRPPGGAIPRAASLVTTIQVARHAEPGDRSGTIVPDPGSGALQGATVTIVDTLTADELRVGELSAPRDAKREPPEEAAASPLPPSRFYFTLPRSARKRPGPASAAAEVPLAFVPDQVHGLRAAMAGHDIRLQWEPSGGILGWLLDRPLAPEVPLATPAASSSAPAAPLAAPAGPLAARPSTPEVAAPSTPPAAGPTRYNIYRELAPDPLMLTPSEAPSPWTMTPATPINPQPVAELAFLDADVPFDERERCYQVRAVRGTGALQVESEASNRACIVPVDLEPPVAPTGLSPIVLEGEVQLRWEPNGEADLRGYIVLRREGVDDTLVELTNGPTTETRFTDTTVMAGRMYTYVVQAVDNRVPLPNVSDPTDITVTAR